MNQPQLLRLGLAIASPLLVLTLACGLIYTAVQQNYRQSANDPQIQMVEDTILALTHGAAASSLIGNSVDPSLRLAPFVIIYDDSGKVVASGAQINGQIPNLPAGVFDDVRVTGKKMFTWQTKDGTRMAVVMDHYSNGFVLSGRSLREVEIREHKLLLMTEATWLAGLIGLIALSFIKNIILPRR